MDTMRHRGLPEEPAGDGALGARQDGGVLETQINRGTLGRRSGGEGLEARQGRGSLGEQPGGGPLEVSPRAGELLVSSIQRFSLHDGPGIRTTVFLKGCPVRCPWCSNPENIAIFPEPYRTASGMRGVYGTWMPTGELCERVLRDRAFYEGGGGVTYSGGEPLLQANALVPVMRHLHDEGVHQAAETSLFVPRELLDTALRHLDMLLVDVKILDVDECREVLGGDLGLYLRNLDLVFEQGVPVIFRVPLIAGYTDSMRNCGEAVRLVSEHPCEGVDILAGHNLGASKYESLGLVPPEIPVVGEVALQVYHEAFERVGVSARVCRI